MKSLNELIAEALKEAIKIMQGWRCECDQSVGFVCNYCYRTEKIRSILEQSDYAKEKGE